MRQKIVLAQDIDSYNLVETKKRVNNYFEDLKILEWEQAKLRARQGLTASYNIAEEKKNHPCISIGRDEFNLSAIEDKDGEIEKHLSGYYWAKSILSEQEQRYIIEYFVNGKYEDEVVNLLGFNGSDSWAFRKLKRRAIYKFAYVLNLIV